MCHFQRAFQEFVDLFQWNLFQYAFAVQVKWSMYYSTLKPINNTFLKYGTDCLKKKKKKSVSFQKEFPILKASLVIQMVKNTPTMQETQLQSRVQEDPWRRDWLPTPVFLLGEFHGQRSLVAYSPQGRRVRDNWVTNTFTFTLSPYFETQTLPNFRFQLITESWLLSICFLVS